mgnify:CR=1 FL=1
MPSRRSSACRARARRRSVRAHARSWAGQTRADRRTFERSARRVEDTCGWRTCRAGRGAHSAHRPVNTGKGGLSTEREQGRVRSDSTPGEATGQARAWRIYAHLLARAATMSHLSMAGGVPRGPLLAWLQISPGRAGSVHTFGQKPYQRESIYKDMPGKPRALEAIIRKWAGRSASAHLASRG